MQDLFNTVRARRSLSPAARTADADGATVDRDSGGEFYQEALVVITTGTITDGTHTFEVQESDDDSTWDAVADADLQGTEPAVDDTDDDDAVFEIGYLGLKRFVRVAVTVASATTGGVYGAAIVLGSPRNAPPDRS